MVTNIIRFILGDINIWAPCLAAGLGLWSARKNLEFTTWCQATLPWYVFWVIGIYGIHGFIFHAFFGQFVAQTIGWANSPFQYEVAVANGAFGVLGIMAFFRQQAPFYLATLTGFAVWFMGDGIGHVYQLVAHHNIAPNNSGTLLYTDFLLPIIGLILYKMRHVDTR